MQLLAQSHLDWGSSQFVKLKKKTAFFHHIKEQESNFGTVIVQLLPLKKP